MTQEQKAKAYDEAIEKAKEIIKYYKERNRDEASIEDLEIIFPEFKESEDEKIKKSLINYIKTYGDSGDFTKEEYITWLEKQKPIDEEEVLKGARMDVALSIINYLDNNSVGMCLSNMECEDIEDACVNSKWTKLYNYMKKKLEKQGEQNTADNPKFKVGDIVQYITDSTDRRKIEEVDTLCNMYHTDSSPIMFEIEDEWKVVVNAEDVEQNPAELPQGFYYVDKDGNKLYSGNGYIKLKVNDWSEEDENILKAITYTVKNSGYKQCIGVSNEIMVNWLKSLKDKHTWKPSDAQMGSLANACDGKIVILDYLNSLYQDLKKLKE